MANDTVKSASITNLDAEPLLPANAGQGSTGRVVEVDDYCTATAAGLQSSGSYYKIVRIPTAAIVKGVNLFFDAGPNLNGNLSLDLNLIFSDSTDDGTPTYLQGLIPTSANTGGTTTIASYSSPNKIFGAIYKPGAGAGAIGPTDFVFSGLGANYALTGGFQNLPLWQIFGFTDGRGYNADPGGWFDLMVYVLTGATTGGACNIYAKVSYTI
jgi:hypothetical protein